MTKPKRVLYVEDDDHNYLLVERTLEATGLYQVLRAVDGPGGLAAARALTPDLILMDVNLPGMNGLALTRRIREEAALAEIPVVALTANVMPGQREEALAAGCVDYIPKPFGLRAFRERIAKLLEESAVEHSTGPQKRPDSGGEL